MWMWYGERKISVIFGGGQRSSGVTRGQTLKTLFIPYRKVGSLDRFHTKYVDVLWCKEKPYCFFVEVTSHLRSPEVKN
ncbi:hypothetical protein HOLleu_33987 [Holothuria leucospilota]|uniref:Uncharacterized protein n=1 Tax=Holothuria leucospilota TaxID=206669 RepID=A0A9Q0YRP4_HOLLE|nr:hypothetical protein HOLleu_33987 [Holothuria leucospilota]